MALVLKGQPSEDQRKNVCTLFAAILLLKYVAESRKMWKLDRKDLTDKSSVMKLGSGQQHAVSYPLGNHRD